MGNNSWPYDSSQRVIIVDLITLVNGLQLLTFGFVHLNKNKFESSHSFMKSHLIGHHLLFDNQSKNILNVFDLVLMRNCFELDIRKFCWKVLNILECLAQKFLWKWIYVISPVCNYN